MTSGLILIFDVEGKFLMCFSLFHSLKCENIIKYDFPKVILLFPKYDYFHNPLQQWLICMVETFMFCWFLGMLVHGPQRCIKNFCGENVLCLCLSVCLESFRGRLLTSCLQVGNQCISTDKGQSELLICLQSLFLAIKEWATDLY